MAERKHKHESHGSIQLDVEEPGFILEPTQVEVGSGYTVSISYDENQKPIVAVKTYGEVDMAKLRKEIERIFPNAQIRQLRTQSVTLVKKRKRKRSIRKK